jgi:peptide/nickel transport system permease protein
MRHLWHQIGKHPLARIAAIALILLYGIAIAAEFVAPYDAYTAQPGGALLPPTAIHWRSPDGQWLGPHVYPTTLGGADLETGEQELKVDRAQPSPLALFVKGQPYRWLGLIPGDHHLFGTRGPGKINLLGTDEQGRDQLSRLIHGSRISLSIGLLGIAIAFPIGTLMGGISGYFGGWIDAIIMRATEVLMTIPGIYLLVALSATLPPSLSSSQRFALIVVIISFISWAGLARVVRGQVLSIKEQDYVQAARVMGAGPLHIIVRHMLPQTVTYLAISATLAVPGFIMSEAVLSLIGLGIQQPDPSWGNLLSLGTNASILVLHPWLVWSPAIAIVTVVLAFNALGDGLRDALDPRSR